VTWITPFEVFRSAWITVATPPRSSVRMTEPPRSDAVSAA
jgi:hypothetical protein